MHSEHDPFGKYIRENNISLTEFAGLPGVENTATRWLDPEINFLRADFDNTFLIEDRGAYKHLERAKSVLDECICVGLVEEFPTTLKLFERIFGWPASEDFCVNATKQRPSLTELDGVVEIERANRYDAELYAYARNNFEKQCKEYGLS